MEKKKLSMLTKKKTFSWVKAEVHINDKFENTNESDAEQEVKLPGNIQERMFGSEIPRCYNFVPGHCFWRESRLNYAFFFFLSTD